MDDRSLCDSRRVRARSSILEFMRVRYLNIDQDKLLCSGEGRRFLPKPVGGSNAWRDPQVRASRATPHDEPTWRNATAAVPHA